jgi:hypothetical protein
MRRTTPTLVLAATPAITGFPHAHAFSNVVDQPETRSPKP